MSRFDIQPTGDLDRDIMTLANAINSLARFIDFGTGAPTHTPTGRAIYINLTGGAGTTLYVWQGAAWAGK